MKTYSVLSYNRTGSTVVGQCLAAYFGLEYQAEITNIPDILMRYDKQGRSYTVDYTKSLPVGTFNKTYDIIKNRVEKTLLYDNPVPFSPGTAAFKNELSKRKDLLLYNAKSQYKSIFKIQTQKFMENFKDNHLLNDYTFIFCARRNIREQILSYLIAMETKLFHIGYENQIVNLPPVKITRDKFLYCLQGLKYTNQMFELHRDKIETVIYYEDWQDDTSKILPLLGFKHIPAKTFKKINYSVGPKQNLVENLQEVYEWMDNESEFNYEYKL